MIGPATPFGDSCKERLARKVGGVGPVRGNDAHSCTGGRRPAACVTDQVALGPVPGGME